MLPNFFYLVFQRTGILTKRDNTTLRLLIRGKHAGARAICQKQAVTCKHAFFSGGGECFFKYCRIQGQDEYEVQQGDNVVNMDVSTAHSTAMLLTVLEVRRPFFNQIVLGVLQFNAGFFQGFKVTILQTIDDRLCFDDFVCRAHFQVGVRSVSNWS